MIEDYEYSMDVPELTRGDDTLTIHMNAVGGGTVGEAYAHNGWEYAVTFNGDEVITGSDLRSNATPGTHASMARTLAGFLSAAGESFSHSGDRSEYADEYMGSARDFLESEHERLSLFSADFS